MAAVPTKATRMIARNSGEPSEIAKSTTCGMTRTMSIVPIVPAMKEPIAEVASACAARPVLAILLPSRAVTTEADSPGVLSRIDVVDPPYMPP